ncbi:MAG TPA: hypothetical protein EYG51_01245 [Pseudomonadales bacterium]|nr:hypothetical protein [Pseudomonadales bacterium]
MNRSYVPEEDIDTCIGRIAVGNSRLSCSKMNLHDCRNTLQGHRRLQKNDSGQLRVASGQDVQVERKKVKVESDRLKKSTIKYFIDHKYRD